MTRLLFLSIMWLCMLTMATAQAPSVSYDGFTEPSYNILVAAMELGRIESVAVKVGDRVNEGDVIASLESELQVSAVKIAKMQTTMRGELDAATAERDLQLAKVKALRTLKDEAMTRPDELSRAEMELRVSEARLATAQEQTQFRELELERYELQLARRQVLAPMSGIVAEVLHQSGEYVTPGDAAVVRLIVVDTIYAVFSVPVEEVSTIEIGANVAVFLRSSGETVSAKVESLSPEIDGESGTVPVRVALPNQSGKFRIGDRCTMRTILGSSQTARVPQGGRSSR